LISKKQRCCALVCQRRGWKSCREIGWSGSRVGGPIANWVLILNCLIKSFHARRFSSLSTVIIHKERTRFTSVQSSYLSWVLYFYFIAYRPCLTFYNLIILWLLLRSRTMNRNNNIPYLEHWL
jgi:hypothetical protein